MTAAEARIVLGRPLCWCGRRKFEGHPLCGHCWVCLDAELKAEMRQKIGQGFEQSYELIVPMLKMHVRPRHAVPPRAPAAKPVGSAEAL